MQAHVRRQNGFAFGFVGRCFAGGVRGSGGGGGGGGGAVVHVAGG